MKPLRPTDQADLFGARAVLEHRAAPGKTGRAPTGSRPITLTLADADRATITAALVALREQNARAMTTPGAKTVDELDATERQQRDIRRLLLKIAPRSPR